MNNYPQDPQNQQNPQQYQQPQYQQYPQQSYQQPPYQQPQYQPQPQYPAPEDPGRGMGYSFYGSWYYWTLHRLVLGRWCGSWYCRYSSCHYVRQ